MMLGPEKTAACDLSCLKVESRSNHSEQPETKQKKKNLFPAV